MAVNKTGNKRRADRIKWDPQLQCTFKTGRKILNVLTVQNYSGTGIKVEIDRALKKGERVSILLSFPQEKKPIKLHGEVAWHEKIQADPPRYGAGIRFIDFAPHDQKRFILLFCGEMMAEFLHLKGKK